MLRRLMSVLLMTVLATFPASLPASNLHIRDMSGDTGIEPNTDPGLIYLSPDIWVRKTPDPAYQPYPFPDAGPMPWTQAAHENAEYRDPRLSVPNWVYVRVRNTGTVPSTGTERLRVYWTKASTGTGWPTQWVDYLASNCGPTKLYGAEITKERKNAATVSTAERNAFRDAILSMAITTDPALRFSNASYWHKQDEVHELGPGNRHGQAAFLPWHREMINRFEILLQEHDPLVKLLYWDWTTSPVSLFTPTFMGNSGLGTTAGVSIGPPFMPALAPPTVIRRLETISPTTVVPDTTLVGTANYPSFRSLLEGTPHNASHLYIGGYVADSAGNPVAPIGNMADVPTATEDPFFFLLHTNADRLWARWQRNPSSATVRRLHPPDAYYANSNHPSITGSMAPWNGIGPAIEPWATEGHAYAKTGMHPSVVSPPIYDTSPLVVPVLNPGEAVVIQVPWYPPNPANYSCFGADEGHFCLLARIESGPAPMFGMTHLEGSDIGTNVRNNRDIAWKNVTVDEFSGIFKVTTAVVRNIFSQPVFSAFRFTEAPDRGTTFRSAGRITVDLGPQLFQRWVEGGSVGRGIQKVTKRRSVRSLEVSGDAKAPRLEIVGQDAALENIRLQPGETFPVHLHFELAPDYEPVNAVPAFDIEQLGTPQDRTAFVGGQRFEIDLSKIVLIRKADDEWRVLDDGSDPGPTWFSYGFSDTHWKRGRAELGFGDEPETTIAIGSDGRRFTTTYFRHDFDVSDPTFIKSLLLRLKRDDGAVVYLNGTEIHRVNLRNGTITAGTLAERSVEGVEEEMFFPFAVDSKLLRTGRNVVAVELHQDSLDAQDASFDLELSANRADSSFPPDAEFAAIDGALAQVGQSVNVAVDALDSDGQVKSVALFLDDQLIGTDPNVPFAFTLPNAALGSHRLRAIVTDDSNQQGVAHASFNVLENTPPIVQLIQPRDRAEIPTGQTITASVLASDPGGAVERVEFYLQKGNLFGAPESLIGTAFQPPYSVTLPPLAVGHYMITAVAWDSEGDDNTAAAHFTVHAAGHSH